MAHQRVGHTGETQTLCKERQHRVGLHQVGQHITASQDGAIQHVYNTIGYRVVILHHFRCLVNVVNKGIVIGGVRVN